MNTGVFFNMNNIIKHLTALVFFFIAVILFLTEEKVDSIWFLLISQYLFIIKCLLDKKK